MSINDVENSAKNIDGTPDIETDGIDEIKCEMAKAKGRFDEAVKRNKNIGEHSRGGGGGTLGKVAEFLGNDSPRDSGRDR